MFTEKFDNYVIPDDTIETTEGNWTITARVVHDADSRIDDDDVHNTDQEVTGCNDEQFKELLDARQLWFEGEWYYCGIILSVSYNDEEVDDHAASLWGIEANYPGSSNAYLTDVANELLEEAIESGGRERKRLMIALAE